MAATIKTLNSEEEQICKKFLEKVNISDNDNLITPVPGTVAWNCAVRFLMARKFDVDRALELYYSHQEVRKKEGIIDIEPFDSVVKSELLSEKFTVLPFSDNSGAAIALFTARLHVPANSTHANVLKGLIFQLDVAVKSLATQRNGLVFIYDMSGSRYSNFDYELSIKILSLLKGSYPARLKKVLIVTAPMWFKAPFKILRLFVREKLRDRVYTVNVNQLSLHIPLHGLPSRLGGQLDINHKGWLRTCLLEASAVNANMDNEISAFLDDYVSPDLTMSTSISSSLSASLNGDEGFGISTSEGESLSSECTVIPKNELIEHYDSEKEVTYEKEFNSNKRLSDTIYNDSLSFLPNKRRPLSDYMNDNEESLHNGNEKGYSIKELIEQMNLKGKQKLYQEYDTLKQEPPKGTFNSSKKKSNVSKNRYTDVLCLDHSRVNLTIVDEDASSDYINANYVDGYKHKNAYISTQGPLAKTFSDYWRMIWEVQALIIVMTTRAVERGRQKCGQYWPLDEDTGEKHGNYMIVNNGVDKRKDYTVNSLIIQSLITGESREITHFQFTSWPDYGVPHSAAAFLSFMTLVREHQAARVEVLGDHWNGHPKGPPIVVHCSAGIGRTGTFITMDICTQQLVHIGSVDIYKTVQKIRSQRASSIQMPDQYIFCHSALIEYALKTGYIENVDLASFDEILSDSEG